jgi:hypothetical protein
MVEQQHEDLVDIDKQFDACVAPFPRFFQLSALALTS